AELVLGRLLLRDLRTLRSEARTWLRDPAHQDGAGSASLPGGTADFDDTISIILTTTIYRAFAVFEFALATGFAALHEEALALLTRALRVASDSGAVSLWWIIRVALNLIDDLWAHSLHRILPPEAPQGAGRYEELRELFLASLYSRAMAEIELWPSQLEATHRATDL